MPSPRPRWRRRKEARPAEIVSAALELFATHGYAATKLDAIAARAGVSKGTLYLYFPSKEDLFKAVVRELLLPNLAVAEARLEGAKGPTPAVLGEILGGLGKVAASPLGAIPKLVIAEAGNFPNLAKFHVEAVAERGLAMFERLLARGIAAGEFRALDPASVAPMIAAPILMLALWKHVLEPHARRTLDPARFVAAYVDVLLDGLRPRAGKGGRR